MLHTSDVFYRFYHFPYWKLSIGKWLWPRYMRLFSKRECCDFIKYDAQGTDCENEHEGDDGDCDRKYHNDEQRKKAEREEKEQEVSQGSELHDFDNDNMRKNITKDNLKREHIYDEVLLDSPCANAHR